MRRVLTAALIVAHVVSVQAAVAGQRPGKPAPVALRMPDAKGPYCGVYSLVACLNAAGVNANIQDLVSVDYIGSRHGSSAIELIKGAEVLGGHAKCFTNLTHRELQRCRTPMVLHVRGRSSDTRYGHWVAFLGFKDGRAIIFDPPGSMQTLSPGEVLANWDGLGIAVSKDPIDHALIDSTRVDYLLAFGWLVAALCWIKWSRSSPVLGHKMRPKRLVGQAGGLLVLAATIAVCRHSISETGFLRNRAAVADVTRRYYSARVPDCSRATVQKAIRDNAVTLIDARKPRDFRLGAIPGAVNLPITAPLPDRSEVLARVEKTRVIIVYCQSAGCPYSDEMALFLKFNGYDNVKVFRGGYREWVAETIHSADQRR